MLSKLPIAVQVYSVRDDAAADFKGTLQKLKDMGYDGVELAGLYGMTAAEVRAALDEVGIPAISAHVPYAELVADPEGTIAAYVSEDGKVGSLIEVSCETDFVATNAKFKGFVADLAKVVAECDPADVDAFLAVLPQVLDRARRARAAS